MRAESSAGFCLAPTISLRRMYRSKSFSYIWRGSGPGQCTSVLSMSWLVRMTAWALPDTTMSAALSLLSRRRSLCLFMRTIAQFSFSTLKRLKRDTSDMDNKSSIKNHSPTIPLLDILACHFTTSKTKLLFPSSPSLLRNLNKLIKRKRNKVCFRQRRRSTLTSANKTLLFELSKSSILLDEPLFPSFLRASS